MTQDFIESIKVSQKKWEVTRIPVKQKQEIERSK